MTDLMLDLETTGLDPHGCAIIQLSAIKFNIDTRSIGSAFDRCPMPLPFRRWDDSTRGFWMGKNRPGFEQIILRQEPPIPVFTAFKDFANDGAPEGGFRCWSKPSKFDWPMLESHMIQIGLEMPFNHRASRDLNSFICGLRGDAAHPDVESELPFNGVKHNALHDNAYQIEMLFYALDRFIHAEIVK